jgi:hypothetical protein
MNLLDTPNMLQSAIRANSELLNMEKEVDRKISYKQLEEIKSIAKSTQQQLKIMEEQLSKYKNELESAKKDLLFSKITTVIAIIISIVAIVIPLL